MNRRDALALLASGALGAAGGCRNRAAMPADLAALDCIGQADLAASRAVSKLELVDAAIERIERINPTINAVVFTDFDRARAAVAQARGPLAGVPYLLKDLNAYRGMPLTRGSRLFRDTIADSQTAFTDRIDAAGLVTLGKTNTPEFGLLPSTEPLLHGATRNPWQLAHSVGGSSGGAAAAVAARLVPAAQGGDGGGSIRIPAAQAGLVGLKPSVGRFPDQGHGDQPWPISIKHALTRSVRDSALLLALTEQTTGGALLPVGYVVPERLPPQRIALTLDTHYGAPSAEVAAATERVASLLADMGHTVERVEQDTPLHDASFSRNFLTLWAGGAVQAVQAVEAQTGAAAEQTELLEPATIALARSQAGRPADALERAIEGLGQFKADMAAFFERYDAWLTPVTATTAPALGEMSPQTPLAELMPRVQHFAGYTPCHNAAGTPAISLPAGLGDKGLPIGVQLSAAIGNEALLLQFAYRLEAAAPWADTLPPVHA